MCVSAAPAVAFGRDQHMLAWSGQQMTTDRTTIRRWLQVGGSAHRPPFATRKARHRSIVAPLAATLAATAAVGIGVVLARAGGERRSKRLRRRERRLGLTCDERLTAGLRRMAIAQAELAIEELEGAEPAEHTQGGPRDSQGDQAPANDRQAAGEPARRGRQRSRARIAAGRRRRPRRRQGRRGHARRPSSG